MSQIEEGGTDCKWLADPIMLEVTEAEVQSAELFIEASPACRSLA
jgi:hypothetical protein